MPLYHVEGKENVANLLTKEHPITFQDVSQGLLWESGYDLMTKPLDQLPLEKYDQIFLRTDDENMALEVLHRPVHDD